MEANEMQPILDRIPEKWGKYVSFNAGWNQLVLNLDKELAELDPTYEVHQAKEKFGGLRYYAEPSQAGWEAMDEDSRQKFRSLISAAEAESTRTCETCGKPGMGHVSGYWHYTACEEHIDEGS